MAQQRTDFTQSDIRPPGPSSSHGYKINPKRGDSSDPDESHYILIPDREFNRPWLASPQGNSGIAYVWPLGVEGFSFASNADAGIHHYIGDNDVDVDVVYPDESHIVLTGIFPGDTSTLQKQALRNVVLHQADTPGKILGLPGIEEQILYVSVINHSFSHDQGDYSKIIAYSIEFIKIGVGGRLGSTIKQLPKPNPTTGASDRGKSQKRATVKGGKQTLRGVSKKVYGSSRGSSVRKLQQANSVTLNKSGIPSYKTPYTKVPIGTTLKF